MKREEHSKGEQKIINMIEDTCLKVDRDWYISLTDQQKHDAIMELANGMLKGIEAMERA